MFGVFDQKVVCTSTLRAIWSQMWDMILHIFSLFSIKKDKVLFYRVPSHGSVVLVDYVYFDVVGITL